MKKTAYKDLLRDDLNFKEAKKIQTILSYEILKLDSKPCGILGKTVEH